MFKTKKTFKQGGVHPAEHKDLACSLPIEKLPVPKDILLFTRQHVGVACTPLLKAKDPVTVAQKICSTNGKLGAELHSPVNGTIKDILNWVHPVSGDDTAVWIESDGSNNSPEFKKNDWKGLPKEELLRLIQEAGIVGMGGAGFPAHAKLNLKPDIKLDTLILNGAECEPYLTCDHRMMLEYGNEIIEGAKITLTILGIKKAVIAIEDNKQDAIASLNKLIENSDKEFDIEVLPMQVKYPQGSADQIMESVTGRIRPSGKRSSSIGIIVQNVGTIKTIYDAVVLHKPYYEKVITVSGLGIKRRANLLVPIGTKLKDIVDYLGGTTDDLAKIIVGGPMMGVTVSNLDVPIIKTTAGILFLTKDEIDDQPYGPCINCGFCLDACPMGLDPRSVSMYVESGRGAEAKKFEFEDDCFECGSCAFVCPSKRPLVQFLKIARQQISRAEKKS
jgi:Na+-translocating ferredoxin:NAD+ oxidoreductase subunit C